MKKLVSIIIAALMILLVGGTALIIGIPIEQDKQYAANEGTIVEEAPFKVTSFDEHYGRYGVSYRLYLSRDGHEIGRVNYDKAAAISHDGAINEHAFYRPFENVKAGEVVWLRYIRGKNTGEYFFIEKVEKPDLPQSSIDDGFGE